MIGGPPVRPLDRFQTRVSNDQLEVGPRYSVTSQLEPVRARDPGEFTGGIWEYLYPPRPDDRAPALADEAAATRRTPQAAEARRRRRRERRWRPAARQGREGGRHRRRRLGRRAHRRLPVSHRIALSQGPEGDELVLHPRLGDPVRLRRPGDHRGLPGDVLRAVLDGGLRLDHPPDQRRLPRRVRARTAQVGGDGDDHPDLPAHGPDLLLRRLQVPARAQLGDRGRAPDPDPGDGADRLPAARSTSAPTGRRSWR